MCFCVLTCTIRLIKTIFFSVVLTNQWCRKFVRKDTKNNGIPTFPAHEIYSNNNLVAMVRGKKKSPYLEILWFIIWVGSYKCIIGLKTKGHDTEGLASLRVANCSPSYRPRKIPLSVGSDTALFRLALVTNTVCQKHRYLPIHLLPTFVPVVHSEVAWALAFSLPAVRWEYPDLLAV